ncbi:hypothetical protein PRIPAC_78234 [Pristionchus pacificus]|uniref:Uncharacterized protein n=1 Tax=Pristionchus pacificus TaxID=54126 RepID=A0A2A6BE37_PRIPA|nr:hypothetical protein PRIPAC_78234 [Pristionchus pacificus]|eukprot:PDM64133.1 hypothetical protein PRIPAC_54377 [Pristionchus pacificus]
MIFLLTFLLSLTLATDGNWTSTPHLPRNGSITDISTTINGTDGSSIVIPLIVNGKLGRDKPNRLNNRSYHLNIIGGSFNGNELSSKCKQIKDERDNIHIVCSSETIGRCSREGNVKDLRVNSISIIDSNDSFDISWNCPSGEICCDYGCCQSDGFDWEVAVISIVILFIFLLLLLFIYCCYCRNKREEKTHRHPFPTVSIRSHQRKSSIRIRVLSDPSHSLNSTHLSSSSLPSSQLIRYPTAPAVSYSDPSPNYSPYPLIINPTAPPLTSSERSLPDENITYKSTR